MCFNFSADRKSQCHPLFVFISYKIASIVFFPRSTNIEHVPEKPLRLKARKLVKAMF